MYPAEVRDEAEEKVDKYNRDNNNMYDFFGGTRLRSSLRHCATSRKVACSIPDGATGNFSLTQLFRPIYSAPNINEYREYFLGGGIKAAGDHAQVPNV